MAASKGMSLRKIAKELGVSHSLLVLWRQGKRSLSPQLEARYHQLVTSVTTLGGGGGKILSGEARFGIKSPVLCQTELTAQGCWGKPADDGSEDRSTGQRRIASKSRQQTILRLS